MGDRSAIEWTDATWNPVTGCEKISAGCKNCYAAEEHARRHKAYLEGKKVAPQYSRPFEVVQLHPDRLTMPLRWQQPKKIFVNSGSDLFHEDVPEEFIQAVVGVALRAPRHTFQVLTKRPARMREIMYGMKRSDAIAALAVTCPEAYRQPLDIAEAAEIASRPWPPENLWLGVSVEDQAAADARIPQLLWTPAAVRFLSCEPLIAPVDLTVFLPAANCRECGHPEELHGYGRIVGCQAGDGSEGNPICGCRKQRGEANHEPYGQYLYKRHAIDWVIVGGESGPHARPMHPDWARSLRDQCAAAGVAFFFKQWGEYGPVYEPPYPITRIGKDDVVGLGRIGKARAGRELDGVVHDAFPTLEAVGC